MAAESRKRPLGSEANGTTSRKANKRRKPSKDTSKPINSSSNAKGTAAAPVSLDDLDWKTVDIPDRLEDVEGFFGLEEIDGVDVVKGGLGGQVQYRVG